MEQERWRRVEALYHSALERPPEYRVAFLREACADPELRREVETLLAQPGDGILDHPVAQAIAGGRLGPYEIRRLIGAGANTESGPLHRGEPPAGPAHSGDQSSQAGRRERRLQRLEKPVCAPGGSEAVAHRHRALRAAAPTCGGGRTALRRNASAARKRSAPVDCGDFMPAA